MTFDVYCDALDVLYAALDKARDVQALMVITHAIVYVDRMWLAGGHDAS